MEEIRESAGSQLSPEAAEAFLTLPEAVFRELERPGTGAVAGSLPYLRATAPVGE